MRCKGLERDVCWPCGTEIGGGDTGIELVGAEEDREALREALEIQERLGCGYYDLATNDPERVHLANLLQSCNTWWQME